VPRVARAARPARASAARLRHRGSVALRGGFRVALRQGRRRHRALEAPPRALARRCDRTGAAAPRRPGQGEPRRLRLREHRHARGARRVRRLRHARSGVVRRWLGALLLLALLVGGFVVYALQTQPAWYERLRYPLRYSEYVRVHARENDLDPA